MSRVDPIASVSIHEAGHAVMMKVVGVRVESLRIDRDCIDSGEGTQGETQHGACEITREAHAKVIVAGVVAESIAFGGCPVRRLNKIGDGEELDTIMEESGIPKRERAAERRRIIGIVDKRLRKHFDHVVAIAEEVGTYDTCDATTVNRIMRT